MVDLLWATLAVAGFVAQGAAAPEAAPPAPAPVAAPAAAERLLVVPHPPERLGAARSRLALDRLAPIATRRIDGPGVFVVEPAPGEGRDALAAKLRATGDYAIIEPDSIVEPASASNDSHYNKQWYLPHLGVPDAWDLVPPQGFEPIVAVLDTGIDTDHPDLVGRLVSGYNAASRVPESLGGVVEDINGHGTRCAGIVAATINNARGVAGIAPRVRIMPVRVSNNPDGSASLSALFEGIRYAADNGARVATISYAGVSSLTAEVTAAYARSKGCLVVWTTDNFGFDYSWFDHPSVTIVAGTSTSDLLISNCSTGTAVDLVAPGSSIYSTAWGGSYNYGSGVSYAAPIVAGAAALLLNINPDLTPDLVEQALLLTTRDLGAPGDDAVYGHGLVQPLAAATLVLPTVTGDYNNDGAVDIADFSQFLTEWALALPRSDVDQNGAVEIVDYSLFLNLWSTR